MATTVRAQEENTVEIFACLSCALSKIQVTGMEGGIQIEDIGGRAYDRRTSIVADQAQETEYDADDPTD